MSKKKAVSGNTMTLKNFHGGSIPSDISLPSAPGVILRPADRSALDRQSTWGNSMADHRLRPSSSGSIKNLDDSKTPFLSNAVNIGRNFDEDERKPLDGGASAPRRTVSDESFGGSVVQSNSRVDARKSQPDVGVVVPPQSGGSYSARIVKGGGGNANSRPNAWGVRKEAHGVGELGLSPWGGHSTVSKFAQASALDQVSSGRWQTKAVQQQLDVEVIRSLDSPSGLYVREKFVSERECDTTLVSHVEKCLVGDEGSRVGFEEMTIIERVHSPEQCSALFTNEGQPAHPDGKCGDSSLQQPLTVTERPKLKLLPRSKPLDVQEVPSVDKKPGFQQPLDTSYTGAVRTHGNAIHVKPRQRVQLYVDTNYSEAGVFHENGSHIKPRKSISEPNNVKHRPSSSEGRQGIPEINDPEAVHRFVERPKLNLKPRTQPVNNLDESTKEERMTLFGGARPREMVLRERGVDGVITSHDEAQITSRTKKDAPHDQVASSHPNSSRLGERVNNLSGDQRTGRGHERSYQRADFQRADMKNKNWHNNNRRSGRDTEKHEQERQPSPETWRKPVEQPNTDNSELRFGKAVSAVDLVQAFSRSVALPMPVDQFSGQKGVSIHSRVPFSRLTGPATRLQINGY